MNGVYQRANAQWQWRLWRIVCKVIWHMEDMADMADMADYLGNGFE